MYLKTVVILNSYVLQSLPALVLLPFISRTFSTGTKHQYWQSVCIRGDTFDFF